MNIQHFMTKAYKHSQTGKMLVHISAHPPAITLLQSELGRTMSVSKGFDTRSVAVATTPVWISCTFLLHHIHPSTAACMFQYRAETVQLFVLHGIVAEALSWKKSNLFKKKSPARLHYPFPPTTLRVKSIYFKIPLKNPSSHF